MSEKLREEISPSSSESQDDVDWALREYEKFMEEYKNSVYWSKLS